MAERKNPILSASKIAMNETSGKSIPSRKRLIPIKTSISPERKSFKISKAVEDILVREKQDAQDNAQIELDVLKQGTNLFSASDRKKLIKRLTQEMTDAADRMEYELAAALRDQIREIESMGK